MVQKIIKKNREEPIVGIGLVSVSFSIFFRQCALAALKDVHDYLSREEGHVAVKKFAFFPKVSAGVRTGDMY